MGRPVRSLDLGLEAHRVAGALDRDDAVGAPGHVERSDGPLDLRRTASAMPGSGEHPRAERLPGAALVQRAQRLDHLSCLLQRAWPAHRATSTLSVRASRAPAPPAAAHAAVDVRLDRVDRPPQRLGQLRVGQPLDVAQLDRRPDSASGSAPAVPPSPAPPRAARRRACSGLGAGSGGSPAASMGVVAPAPPVARPVAGEVDARCAPASRAAGAPGCARGRSRARAR